MNYIRCNLNGLLAHISGMYSYYVIKDQYHPGYFTTLWLILLLIIPNSLYSQANRQPGDTLKKKDRKEERPKFSPYIAPVVTPEVDLMITVGGLFTFHLHPEDTTLQRSSIPFSIGYSTNSSFNTNFRPNIYGKHDNFRFFGNLGFKIMPDNYWGVGYENGKNVPKSDSTTKYHRSWWRIDINLVRKIVPKFYAGINLDLNHTLATEMNTRMITDPYVVNQGSSFNNSGIGVIAQYDSRDLNVNAYSGWYVSFTASIYRHFLGANTNFNGYLLDYRQYKQIKRPGRTVAWQIKSRVLSDGVPWTDMALLGTPFDLRGYIQGRFRDQSSTFGLIEYRHMFRRKKPNRSGSYKSRHGLVTWVGAGVLTSSVKHVNNWLPNAGIGYRFEVQTRMNVRVDYGIGEDARGFYVSFNESF